MLSKAAHGIGEAIESTNWRTATGRITRSELIMSSRDSRPGETGVLASRRQSKNYSAAIEYAFEVNGVVYEGTRIAAVKEMSGDISVAQAILDKYPVDEHVSVAFQPDKPENCLLEPGSLGGALGLILLGTCFGGLPLFLLRVVWKSNKPNTQDA